MPTTEYNYGSGATQADLNGGDNWANLSNINGSSTSTYAQADFDFLFSSWTPTPSGGQLYTDRITIDVAGFTEIPTDATIDSVEFGIYCDYNKSGSSSFNPLIFGELRISSTSFYSSNQGAPSTPAWRNFTDNSPPSTAQMRGSSINVRLYMRMQTGGESGTINVDLKAYSVRMRVNYTEASTGYANDVSGVAAVNIAEVSGVATDSISKVDGQ